METIIQKLRYTFELIKFSHTIFALPFALVAYFVATGGKLEANKLFWVLVCLVLARTAAMAFNRWADAKWDAQNPRTQMRHLPRGLLSKTYVLSLTIFCSVGFILSAAQLNRLALYLSPLCLGLLFFYSLTKRFTHFTQVFLGLALGMAPIATTIAVTGKITIPSLVLGLAVLLWVAGFDLLYSLQDLEFDMKTGLHSLAVKLGTGGSLTLGKFFHAGFLIALTAYGLLEKFGWIYWMGLAVCAAFLIYEHWTLREGLKNLQAAFFTANGLLSLCFLAFVLADIYI